MADISKPFTVHIQGRGALKFGPADHVASGGEGSIFRKAGIALKVWDDPDRAAKDRMPEKLGLLSSLLRHPCIVAPESLATDRVGRAIGFVMPWVQDAWALPQAFTNDWRAANGFGDAEALAFAARMREVALFAGRAGIVMGDANELNVLGVGIGMTSEPRYIDVDPWVLPGFPGGKILPTVRDWHSPPFSREADWFAWAVTTFQLLVGVHPYRGTHPGFKRADLEGRMLANASVFDPAVRLSPAARGRDLIPGQLRDWYRAVFHEGFRGEPPEVSPAAHRSAARPAQATTLPATGDLVVREAWRLPAGLLRQVAPDVVLLEGGLLASMPDGRLYGTAHPGAAFARLADGGIAAASAASGMLRFGVLRAAPGASAVMDSAGLAAMTAWSAENRLFAVLPDGLLELQPRVVAGRTVALPGRKWSLNANATVFGDSIALLDALGAKFLVAPFGESSVAVLRVRGLDGLRPVAMIRRGRTAVLSLIDAGGSYHRAVVCFGAGFADCLITLEDTDDGSLGDAVTDSGIVVRFAADGRLELFSPASGARRLAESGAAAGGRLLAGPSGVFCVAGDRMLKLSLS